MVVLTDRETIFRDPLHPYTKALLSAIPMPDPTLKRERMILQGDVPSPVNPPKGCRFHTRCPFAVDKCKVDDPPLEELKPGHIVACWVAKEQVAQEKAALAR
jgi:oligopeptide/dipeptide ABC transporter ATP-binding protein